MQLFNLHPKISASPNFILSPERNPMSIADETSADPNGTLLVYYSLRYEVLPVSQAYAYGYVWLKRTTAIVGKLMPTPIKKYQLLKLAKQVPPSEEDDSLFLEAVGGWGEKGIVYGPGNSASLFYERPTNNATAKKPSYTPSIIAQLQTDPDLTKTKLNSTKKEIQ
ncbi:hypothetical protein Cgig2_033237 [Carnegiea gigantea]|uniref:Uncharacterized protein n=1 Tax=Carnegiea gigantea TaxID=171969 RepID=A0A9Q1GU31_9CARY|nr:hypothetical protein Cgig2_033237 [Carnegiea gigantea]